MNEFTKGLLIGLYNDKVYVGSKVRELALNYMLKGCITEDTLVYVDNYITNAEKPIEVPIITPEEIIEPTDEVEEIIENTNETTTEELIEEVVGDTQEEI
jgi:hypothetical protein